MKSAPSKLTIVAPTPEECASVSGLVSGIPDLEASTAPGHLGRMNGTAVAMMRERGIVITRLSEPTETDLEAVETLAQADDREAGLIVISDADMPLSMARRLMQAGVAEVLPDPVDGADLRGAVQRLTRPSQLPAIWTGKQPGRIVTVTRARGGIGATTVAVNLADALATPKKRKAEAPSVALVDFDLQFGAVASFLDLPPRDTLYDLAAEQRMPDARYLDEQMETTADGLRVLTAPARFVPLDALTGEQVAAILESLRETYDYVVVDLPHSLVDWVQAVIDRSDRVLLVTDSTVPSIRQSKRLIDFFEEESPGIPVEIVVNHEAKPLIRAKHHTQAAKLLGQSFNTWLPPDPKTARAAIDRGVPLSVAGRRSALHKSIAQLARSLDGDFSAPAQRRH